MVKDGEIYYCEKNKLIPQPYTGMKAARIKGLCEIRTALLEVISIQSREYDPLDLRKAQDKLNQSMTVSPPSMEPSTAREISSPFRTTINSLCSAPLRTSARIKRLGQVGHLP